jgi:hypothetical protein
MIAVDDKVIDWKIPKTPTDKWVAKEIQKLTETKKRIIYERVFMHNDKGTLITRPQTIFPLEARIKDPTGETSKREKWVLTDPSLYKKDKNIYPPLRVSARLDIDLIVENDPEKAFFISVIMGNMISHYGYKLRDYDKEAEDLNEKESLEIQVGNIILNELSNSDIELRCRAVGINVEDKGIARLKRELYQAIKKLNDNKSSTMTYQKFIKESKSNSEELQLKAYVAEAFKEKILVLENLQVKYKDSDTILCIIPSTQLREHMNYVVNFLLAQPEEKATFLISVSGTVEELAQKTEDFENINNVAKLKSIAINRGVPKESILPNARAEDIKTLIREKV